MTQSPGIDNWFADRLDNESTEDYIARTAARTRQYISSYDAFYPADALPVFEFVFGEKILY